MGVQGTTAAGRASRGASDADAYKFGDFSRGIVQNVQNGVQDLTSPGKAARGAATAGSLIGSATLGRLLGAGLNTAPDVRTEKAQGKLNDYVSSSAPTAKKQMQTTGAKAKPDDEEWIGKNAPHGKRIGNGSKVSQESVPCTVSTTDSLVSHFYSESLDVSSSYSASDDDEDVNDASSSDDEVANNVACNGAPKVLESLDARSTKGLHGSRVSRSCS